jgi:hypothetical protein
MIAALCSQKIVLGEFFMKFNKMKAECDAVPKGIFYLSGSGLGNPNVWVFFAQMAAKMGNLVIAGDDDDDYEDADDDYEDDEDEDDDEFDDDDDEFDDDDDDFDDDFDDDEDFDDDDEDEEDEEDAFEEDEEDDDEDYFDD